MPKKKYQVFETSSYNNLDYKLKNNDTMILMINNAFNDKCIERKSKCDGKTSIEKDIKPYLGNIINDLRASG